MAKRRGNNEGSITKRKDGRWQGYVTVGYDPEAKKPTKQYYYGKTRGEVKDKVIEALGKVQSGTYKKQSKLKMAEWLTTWLDDYMKPSLRTTTWESYKVQVDKHILPALGHILLSQLQTSHLQKLYNAKLKDGRADGKEGGLSARSVRYIHNAIHGALEQAKKEGIIPYNVADAVKLPKEEKKESPYLDTEGVKLFLSAAQETKHFPAYFLALNTGLRRGELLGLRHKDVDLEGGTITVSQGLVRTKGGLKFQEPKTKLSNRTIMISNTAIAEFTAHIIKQNDEKQAAGEAYEDSDLVFCNELGRPICPRGFTRHFERLLKRCNDKIVKEGLVKGLTIKEAEKDKLPQITFHSLRRTFATLSLQQGTDARTIQEALGHHKAAFTLDVYSNVTSKMKKETTDKIGDLLASCLKK